MEVIPGWKRRQPLQHPSYSPRTRPLATVGTLRLRLPILGELGGIPSIKEICRNVYPSLIPIKCSSQHPPSRTRLTPSHPKPFALNFLALMHYRPCRQKQKVKGALLLRCFRSANGCPDSLAMRSSRRARFILLLGEASLSLPYLPHTAHSAHTRLYQRCLRVHSVRGSYGGSHTFPSLSI